MRVLNIMLSEGVGGLELAFNNYTTAMRSLGIDVVCCVHPNALILPKFPPEIQIIPLANFSEYDIRAWFRARSVIRDVKPDIVMVHGRRAMGIFSKARRLLGRSVPIVEVLHGPRFRYIHQADHLIVVSNQLRLQAIERGLNDQYITHIPNFIVGRMTVNAPHSFHSPVVIGAFGRLVEVKGFDLLLVALSHLKQMGVPFKAIIGGAGEQEHHLKAIAIALGVSEETQWLGWVENPGAFYGKIDIFCLPSRQESFGMALLEAMGYAKVVVSTRTSGPTELIINGYNGLLCEIMPESIAEALHNVIAKPSFAAMLAANAYQYSEQYNMDMISPRIGECLKKLCYASAIP
jgi:glycosyltransferase involved in cell wall biosynthesis